MEKVLIIHHDDLDGYVSDVIASTYYQNHNYRVISRDAAYSNPHLLDNCMEDIVQFGVNKVVIVDFSFKPDDFRKLISAIGIENVIWIDHHAGIIRRYREDDSVIDQTLIKGLRVSVNFSAAELTYLYYFDNTTQPSFGEDKINYKNDIIIDANKISDRNYVLERLPKALKLSGDWDVWRHKETNDPEAIYLNNWFAIHEQDLATDDDIQAVFFDLAEEYTDELNAMLNEGEIIDSFIYMENKAILKHNAFDAVIMGFEDLHVKAVNADRFTSMIFDDVFNKYEVGVVYVFNGRSNIYSFYRLGENPEKPISCFKIAEAFGGGGHASAAGCYVDPKFEVIRVKKS